MYKVEKCRACGNNKELGIKAKLELVQNRRMWNNPEQFEHGTSLMEEWEAWCTVRQELVLH